MPTPRKSEFMVQVTGRPSRAKAKPPSEDFQLPAGRPRVPKALSKEAKAFFRRMCALMEERRALTEADGELLRVAAVIFDRHRTALAKLAAEGEVRTYTRLDSNGAAHEIERTNLWLKIAETAEKNLVACLDRLGLTPMNRAKVKPTETPKPKSALVAEFPGWESFTNAESN